jgi:tRNA-Thr(GGU) m(6)t(6)A37 methyltransferase TsaA
MEPIGVIRSPFTERAQAPRQASVAGAAEVRGRIELFSGRGYEDALDGLAEWRRLWVIFVFHHNVEQARGWKPKVQPPRSDKKVGLFGTRSPHRPNPIGLSATQIERVDGLTIHVCGLDALDGSPVLDLKPYVAYADSHPDAGAGWLGATDPAPAWEITFASAAVQALAWLSAHGIDLAPSIRAALALGPRPHAYRRIRANARGGMTLALKEWRIDFDVEERTIVVGRIRTGYRASQIATDERLDVHRAFTAAFE